METWKTIKELNDAYSVSNLGKVKNNKTNRILKTKTNKAGYETISITYNKKLYYYLIHRLVLIVFNPVDNLNSFDVHHKDWCVTNNKLENLKWMTREENLSKKLIHNESFLMYRDLLLEFGDDKLTILLLN